MIYLFDNQDKLIHIVSEEELIECVHTVEINAFDEASFEVPIDYQIDLLKKAVYFGFFTKNDVFKVFRIVEKSLKDEKVIKGIDRAESDLHTIKIIKDRRLSNVTADAALHVALEDSGYEVGEVVGLPMLSHTNFYYASPREALVKIIETWNCEFEVRYTFVNNAISSRYIDLFKRQGKPTGRQFYHGDDVLSIEYEESSDDVVTALIGRGKGEEVTSEDGQATGGYGRRIEFTDVVWSRSAGKPIDKPAGQNYVVSEVAREKFGLYQNGQLKHRWGVFIDEKIEDKALLLERTWEELQKLSVPITTYKASLVAISPDIWKGDSVAIIRDDIGIAFEARIHKLVIDKLNNDRSTVELGDYATLKERHSYGNAVRQALNQALDGQSEQLQNFLEQLEKEKERKNAEIDEQFRLAQLNMDNALEGVKNEAEKGRVELAQEIEGKLSEQRSEEQKFRDAFDQNLKATKVELEKNLAESVSSFNVKSQDIFREAANATTKAQEVKAALLAKGQELEQAIVRSKQEAINQAKGLVDGEKRRIEAVENLANGTKSTVTELAKSQETLSRKTQTVEDNLNGLTRRYENLQVGGRNYIRNYAMKDLSLHSHTSSWRFESVEDMTSRSGYYLKATCLKGGLGGFHYEFVDLRQTQFIGKKMTFAVDIKANKPVVFNDFGFETGGLQHDIPVVIDWQRQVQTFTVTTNPNGFYSCVFYSWSIPWQIGDVVYLRDPQLEDGTVATTPVPAPEDDADGLVEVRQNLATYKQTTDNNLSRLTETISRANGNLNSLTTEFNQTRQGIALLAKKEDVDKVNQRLSNTEANLAVQADRIESKVTKADFDQVKNRLSTAETNLAVQLREISSKVSSTDFNQATNRLSQAESQVRQLESSISTKLSRLEVDQLVASKGFATTTTLTHAIEQSERGLTSRISAVDSKIPSDIGSINYVKNGDFSQYGKYWEEYQSQAFGLSFDYNHSRHNRKRSGAHFWYHENNSSDFYGLAQTVAFWGQAGDKVTVSFLAATDGNASGLRIGLHYRKVNQIINQDWRFIAHSELTHNYRKFSQTFTLPSDVDELHLMLYGESRKTVNLYVTNIQIEKGVIATDYHPNTDEFISEVKFHEVKDTVDRHVRTIAEQGNAISQVTQTANSLTNRVTDLKTAISETGGNMLLASNVGVRQVHSSFLELAEAIEKGKRYTVVQHWWADGSNRSKGSPILCIDREQTVGRAGAQYVTMTYDNTIDSWTASFIAEHDVAKGTRIRFGNSDYRNGPYGSSYDSTGSWTFTTLVRGAIPLSVWQPHYSELATKAQTSELTQTVNSIRASVASLDDTSIKKSELVLDNNGFVTKVGKTVDGRTLATMIAQNERDVRIIAEKLKVTGDMLVDGAVTAQKLDTNSVRTGILTADSIASYMLQSDAVLAKHIKAEAALFDKLTVGDALVNRLTAKQAFITSVQAIDLSANRIKSGLLQSRNGAMQLNLDNGQMNFHTDSPAIRRSVNGLPNQFIKFATKSEANDNSFRNLTNDPKNSQLSSITTIGSNRFNAESSSDGGFTGINIIASGSATGDNIVDRIGIHSDITIISHNVVEGQQGWIFENHNGKNNDYALRPMSPPGSPYQSNLGTKDIPIDKIYSGEIFLRGHRLRAILKDLANRVGKTDGWASDFN